MRSIHIAAPITILIVALGYVTGCSNKDNEIRKRVATLDTEKLIEIQDNYPPDSKAALFITEELQRRRAQTQPDLQQEVQVSHAFPSTQENDKSTTSASVITGKSQRSDATTTNKSAKADAIQGVFTYRLGEASQGLSVWLFRADGHITRYDFVNREIVILADASYLLGQKLDAEHYEMTLNTGNEPNGKGVMTMIVDPTDNKPQGFSFSAGGKECKFLGSKATELQALLKDIKGKSDFRRDKNAVWQIIDIDIQNLMGRAE